ncbi:hypothetical protein OEZ85_003812 [Tetradesmus obliquus]|uniref:Mid2 domain-containing protein n=1 Tax=Tetradesmus obliquus TaxID=3088 RepID=A0ABY8UCH3_TETOB|nr:hypothetical protein OEZ85_003812 [Tetradesmus obliquus]
MAHRLVLLLSIWCGLQAAAHGQLRFDKQGKLGLSKQGPALGAIFGPASRLRMAADDSARQQATNDMSSLLLSMINQGGPAAGAPAATQPAELTKTVGFLPSPGNGGASTSDSSSSGSSSSSSSSTEPNAQDRSGNDSSALLEFAAGAPDQPGLEVDLIPTDPAYDTYVPNIGSARSDLDKVHSSAAGLISTRHHSKSSVPLAVVSQQKQQPKLGVGAVVGIAGGGVAVVIVLAVFLARSVYHIRASRARKQSTEGSVASGSPGSSQDADGDTPRSTVDMQQFYTEYSVDLEGGALAAVA